MAQRAPSQRDGTADHGFVGRLLEIATAAARKAAALADLDEEPGPWWARQGAIPNLALSYELRPGGNRPGPAELWASFAATVRELNDAMEAHSAPAEQGALEQLSLVMHEIARGDRRRAGGSVGRGRR